MEIIQDDTKSFKFLNEEEIQNKFKQCINKVVEDINFKILDFLNIEEIIYLFENIKVILSEEALEIRIDDYNTPCLIVGDIHGNYESLHRILRKARILNAFMIFLGDYVDRGSSSLEVLLTLYLIKYTSPKSIILLRGNHEDEWINKEGNGNLCFYQECLNKLGDNCDRVFNLITQSYEYLTISCIYNNIYLVHGGIPVDIYLYNINKLEKPLNLQEEFEDNEDKSILAQINQMLWNDPLKGDEYKYISVKESIRGDEIYNFGKLFVDYFIGNKKISCIIRGHQFFNSGYGVTPDRKVLTIFSCTNYCDLGNDATFVIVTHENKSSFISLIKLNYKEKRSEIIADSTKSIQNKYKGLLDY